MYEVKSQSRTVDGVKLTTWTEEIFNVNILEVEAGTTGYKGGDYGHGGRTYFRLKDLGGTAMMVNDDEAEEVIISFGGDAELDTFIESLEFTLKVLKEYKNRG